MLQISADIKPQVIRAKPHIRRRPEDADRELACSDGGKGEPAGPVPGGKDSPIAWRGIPVPKRCISAWNRVSLGDEAAVGREGISGVVGVYRGGFTAVVVPTVDWVFVCRVSEALGELGGSLGRMSTADELEHGILPDGGGGAVSPGEFARDQALVRIGCLGHDG